MGAFRFKRFSVEHERSSMKVGTDAVLLGSWADLDFSDDVFCHSGHFHSGHSDYSGQFCSSGLSDPSGYSGYSGSSGRSRPELLEVGCGCGVISLMLAQRLSEAGLPYRIRAIDIHGDSCQEAALNVQVSPWASDIEVLQADFLHLPDDFRAGSIDRIVSNPPYFLHSLKSPVEVRNTSRHNDGLPFGKMFAAAQRLLAFRGRLSMVLPSESFAYVEKMAAGDFPDLCLLRKTEVFTLPGKPCRRVLCEWGRRTDGAPERGAGSGPAIYIHDKEGNYDMSYRRQVKDFYLWA